MKSNLFNNKLASRSPLLNLWKKFAKAYEEDNIEEEDENLKMLSDCLPFKDNNQKEKWNNLASTFMCWEDFEELTFSIINQATEKEEESLLESYEEVAKDIALDTDFFTLFNTFARLSNGWVKPLTEWQQHWRELGEEASDMDYFLSQYKEWYKKPFNQKDIYKDYYGFENSPVPQFYANNIEGKSDLFDCIFERYAQGLEGEELIYFYQTLIKELI